MKLEDLDAQPMVSKALRHAVESQRVASAYMFEGPSGVGKRRAALAFACELIGRGDAGIERRILSGQHPDVRVFEPREEGQRNLPVEFVREEILPAATFAPFEADRALFIFPEADVSLPASYPASANAMLKAIEEPRKGVHFILLCEQADRLLVTIRSRCQRIRFLRLPNAAIRRILGERGFASEVIDLAVGLSAGQADRAIAIAQSEHSRSLIDRIAHLERTIESGRAGALLRTAEDLSADESRTAVIHGLAAWYRDVAASGLLESPRGLALEPLADESRRLAEQLSTEDAAERFKLITEAAVALEGPANARLVLETLLLRLARVYP